MSIRRRLWIYLIVVHLLAAGTSIWLLLDTPQWILVIEGVLVLSLVAGARLIRSAAEPLEVLRAGTDLLESRDYGSRFHLSGSPELDGLVRVYNRLSGELREERVRNEEQEHFLRKVLESSTTGVITFDLDGKVALINPGASELLGNESGDGGLVGRRLNELGSAFADALAGLPRGETRVLTLHGRRRVRSHRGTFIDRGFAREFLIFEELTEELRRSEKAAYEKLIRMMSHEVNNTSTGVTSLLTSCLAYRNQIDEADRADFVNAIDVAVSRTRRLNAFVRDFADVVRLPAPTREMIRLPELLGRLRVLLAEECAERRIEWIERIDPELPDQSMDPAQMEQALLNILRNGIEAIGTDGELRVSWQRDGSHLVLTVSDTGGGVTPDARAHLFTPFFTSKTDGQGIGLTLVQEILLGHGFDFALENADGGAAFRIVVA